MMKKKKSDVLFFFFDQESNEDLVYSFLLGAHLKPVVAKAAQT